AQISFLFWPDVPDATARRHLTHLLTLLRRALPQPAVLLTDEEAVALDQGMVWCDAVAFTQLTATVDPHARIAALQRAVQLYHGLFLDGFTLPDCAEFDTWLDQERSAWERRYRDALAAVIEHATAKADYPTAIAAAQRYLAVDDLAEDIHRRLIVLYAASGDRTAALRQYERCAVVLERELGVSPIAETRAVYEAVRNGETPLQTPPSSVSAPSVVPTLSMVEEHTPPAMRLPDPPGLLIGRAAELADITALVQRADVRLLTLSGPGGAGKTRLAIETARAVADHYDHGAAFVPLAPVRDATLVVPAIAATLGLADRSDRPPLVRLQDALRDRNLLLVLDNFEHVADAALDVASLLAAAPRLTVLVTSRALLRIAGEHTYPVPSLALPDPAQLPPPADLAHIDAIALFLARVQARLPGFQLTTANAAEIAAICARLDGLPLAIELAAARAALLSPRMLLARLDRRLAFLTAGPRDLPERQRTLRATIDWSYDLLDLGERLLLGRLAVFAGGWTLAAAEVVCAAVGPLAISVLDGLDALLDKCLVQRTTGSDGEPRFTMLETIREYALERLIELGEAPAAQQAHASYFRDLAERAAPALHGLEQIAWFDQLDEEHANLRV
ncbi:MAG TPA: BTAD domain-containing putative transcriptional regulator, partial [Roseiflexaceae bacterium]